MRQLTCAIVDDEPLAVKLIENYIGRTPFLCAAASFTDPVAAMGRLKEDPVDLVFLDIQMPDMDGLELSHILPPQTRIIFTTAFREYALDSYDVSAVDFLLKPLKYDRFLKAAEKALQWFEMKESGAAACARPPQTADDIFLRVDGELCRVGLDSIVLVEGLKDYVRFTLTDRPRGVVTHLTMKAVEDMLPADRFLRVSRSHIISLSHIRKVDRNMCVYIGDDIIKVTDMYRPAFDAFLRGRMIR